MRWCTMVCPTTRPISTFHPTSDSSSGLLMLDITSNNSYLLCTLSQLCSRGALLLPGLVHHGQVGPALDPLWNHDGRMHCTLVRLALGNGCLVLAEVDEDNVVGAGGRAVLHRLYLRARERGPLVDSQPRHGGQVPDRALLRCHLR